MTGCRKTCDEAFRLFKGCLHTRPGVSGADAVSGFFDITGMSKTMAEWWLLH